MECLPRSIPTKVEDNSGRRICSPHTPQPPHRRTKKIRCATRTLNNLSGLESYTTISHRRDSYFGTDCTSLGKKSNTKNTSKSAAHSRPGCAEHTLFQTDMIFKIFTYFRPRRIKTHTLQSSEAIISMYWINVNTILWTASNISNVIGKL